MQKITPFGWRSLYNPGTAFVVPFQTSKLLVNSLTTKLSSALIAEANDLSLVVDGKGIIRDVALGNPDPELELALGWIGRPWIDTVTIESQPKIKELLETPTGCTPSRWRPVN